MLFGAKIFIYVHLFGVLGMKFTLKNGRHILFMLAPNIFILSKLCQNLRHPIHEWIHTQHEQLPLEEIPNLYLVKHYFFSRLVTLDVIKRVEDGHRGDYYGHCDYFPQTFNLMERIYIRDGKEPNLEKQIEGILASK